MISQLLSHDDLADLGMTLREAGYSVGPEECIAAQRLMVTLAAEGARFSDRQGLRSWLAPIFCASATEQANFGAHYEDWLRRRGKTLPSSDESQSVVTAEGTSAQAGSKAPRQTSGIRQLIAVLVLLAAVSGAVYGGHKVIHELVRRTLHVEVIDHTSSPQRAPTLTFQGKPVPTDSNGGFTLNFRLLDLPAQVVVQKDGIESVHEINADNYNQALYLLLGPEEKAPPSTTNPTRLDLTDQEADVLRQSILASAPAKTDSTRSLSITERFVVLHYRELSAVAILFPLLILGLWMLWTHLPRLQLIRWKSQAEINLDALRVQGSGTEFFTSPGFRRIAQQLRRHRLVQSTDLDADRTVLESAGRGGWFTPVYLLRKRLPDYLILIDRAGFRDFHGRLIEDFVRNLRSGRVEIDGYDFYSDPRVFSKGTATAPGSMARQGARSAAIGTEKGRASSKTAPSVLAASPASNKSPSQARFSLEELLARHPTHNVLIFSDGSGFFSSLTGKLQPWAERFAQWNFRALLVPEHVAVDPSDFRTRMLQDSGFLILSATEKGLSTAVEVLDGGEARRIDVARPQSRGPAADFPPLLRGEELRWLSDLAPRPSQVSLLIGQLRVYLGEETFAWLCACAVYPELLWDLTLYLGNDLNILGPDERRLAMLLNLPWFRHSGMPDWLRERLTAAMTPDELDAVRQALWRLLDTAMERPLDGFELSYATGKDRRPARLGFWKRWQRRLLSNFLRTAPSTSALRDYVFISVLSGRKPGKGVPIPDALRRLFAHLGEPRRPWLQIATAVLTSAIAGAVMYHYRPVPSVLSNTTSSGIQPLPAPTGPPPYHLALEKFLDVDKLKAIESGAELQFQLVGDTSGSPDSSLPEGVSGSAAAHKGASIRLAFLYLLGNIVDGGSARLYHVQFYSRFQDYPGPIFAIAGEGDSALPLGQHSLDGFLRNFCAPNATHLPEAGSSIRTAMTQPNIYWTLDTPYATIVGLYTNVVTGGYIDDTQKEWLISELKSAPPEKALIVAMYDPIYSMTTATSGSDYLSNVLDQAILAAGRAPDLILSGHDNNYQRFSRQLGPGGRIIPYVVIGNGRYSQLQKLAGSPKLPMSIPARAQPSGTLILEQYNDTSPGFLRFTANGSMLKGDYFSADRSRSSTLWDSFTIALNTAASTSAAADQHPLDGLYRSVEQKGAASTDPYWSYLQFYRDGIVLAASTPGNPDEVRKWLQISSTSVKSGTVSSGSYSVDKSLLKFSTTSSYGSVDYSGRVAGDTLELDVRSRINNHRSHDVYQLVPIGGTPEEATRVGPTVKNRPPAVTSVPAQSTAASTAVSNTNQTTAPPPPAFVTGLKNIAPATASPAQNENEPLRPAPLGDTGSYIFDNWNTATVESGPASSPTFTITQPYHITRIQTYHWNDGRGATPVKQSITVFDARGLGIGCQPSASSGQGGSPNVNWECTPEVTLEPGTYRVNDSDRNTWSHNQESGNAGFVRVQGYPETQSNPAQNAASSRPAAPTGLTATVVSGADAPTDVRVPMEAHIHRITAGQISRQLQYGVTIVLLPQFAARRNGTKTVSYNLYRSNVSGGPYVKIASLTTIFQFEDRDTTLGRTYYYVFAEVGENGAESPYSKELRVQMQVPKDSQAP
jgi:hypothetical protein